MNPTENTAGGAVRLPVAVYCGSVPYVRTGHHSQRSRSVDSSLRLPGNSLPGKEILPPALSQDQGREASVETGPPLVDRRPQRRRHSLLPIPIDTRARRRLSEPRPRPPANGRTEVGGASSEREAGKTGEASFLHSHSASAGGPGPSAGATGGVSDLGAPLARSTPQRPLSCSEPLPPIAPGAPSAAEQVEKVGQSSQDTETDPRSEEVLAALQSVRSSALRKRLSLCGTLLPPIPQLDKTQSRSPSPRPASRSALCKEDCMRWRVSPEGDSAPVLESSLPPPRVPEQSADAAGTLRAVAMPTEGEQQAEEDAVSVTAGAGNHSLALLGVAPAVSAGHVGSSLSGETAVDTTHTGPSSQQQTAQPGSDTHTRPCSPPHTGRSVEAVPAGGALLEVPAPLSKSARKKVRERWRKELDRLRRQKQEKHSEGGCGPGSGPSETPAAAPPHCPPALSERSTASTLVPAHSPPGEPPLQAPCPTRRASVAVLRPRHCPSLSSPRRRHSSVLPGSGLFQMSQETGGDSDAEEPRPLSNPELHLTQALRDLQREDWELKTQSLSALRALAAWHSDALRTRLHQVTELVSREVLSLRSGVSRAAMRALGAVCGALGSAMDGELEVVMRALLLRAGDSSEFLREGAQRALWAAVGSVSPARALGSLISTGASHRNPASRCCAAEMMALVLEREGAELALAGRGAGQEELLLALVRLAQDAQQDTRFYGRRMLSLLISHPEFDLLAQRFLSTHDLHFLSTSFQQQVTRGSVAEPPWARGHRSPRVSVTTDVLSSAAGQGPGEQLLPGPRLRAAVLRSLQRGERLKELQALLTAQEHAQRARGVALLLELCTQHPLLITANISKVWDWFGPRLQDPNRKVCLQALDMASQITPLLGNSLNPLLSHLATAAVDNLNAKHPGTAPAAATLLDCLISHCDNALLLQPLASRAQYSSGRAIQEVTERLAVLVRSVARLKPSAVERHVLPALWHLIGQLTSGGAGGGRAWRGALGRLARGLWDTLPDRLQASAESRPPAQRDALQEILGSPVEGLCPHRDEGAGGDREDRTSGDEREDGHGPAGQMEETAG